MNSVQLLWKNVKKINIHHHLFPHQNHLFGLQLSAFVYTECFHKCDFLFCSSFSFTIFLLAQFYYLLFMNLNIIRKRKLFFYPIMNFQKYFSQRQKKNRTMTVKGSQNVHNSEVGFSKYSTPLHVQLH